MICRRLVGRALCLLLLSGFAADSKALLLGEKAKSAPLNTLNTALNAAAAGKNADVVWQTTRWYCPTAKRGECRWELPKHCIGVQLINLAALKHSAFTGETPLIRIFNAACLWRQYPQMKNRVSFHTGDCDGNYGYATHDGTVCINVDRISRRHPNCVQYRQCPEAFAFIHEVILHELQHQIQFVEGWPASARDCPYLQRKVEREAFYVGARARWEAAKQQRTAPDWYRKGFC